MAARVVLSVKSTLKDCKVTAGPPVSRSVIQAAPTTVPCSTHNSCRLQCSQLTRAIPAYAARIRFADAIGRGSSACPLIPLRTRDMRFHGRTAGTVRPSFARSRLSAPSVRRHEAGPARPRRRPSKYTMTYNIIIILYIRPFLGRPASPAASWSAQPVRVPTVRGKILKT